MKMREILFRGKRVDDGEWVYGSFVMDVIELLKREQLTENPILADGFIRRYDFQNRKVEMHEVERETVGQYTGLTDRNGTKIFEGDIVKTDKFSEPNKIYIIKYDLQFAAFICEDKWNMYFVTFDGDSEQFEVIGNIHDNPELLEE